jgi:Tetratricopeptide repeat
MSDSNAPFDTLTMARIHLDQGNLDEAEKIYRHLADKAPHDPEAAAGLADIQRLRRVHGSDRLASLLARWMELVPIGQRIRRLQGMKGQK